MSSHFNTQTALDAGLYYAKLILLTVLSLCIIYVSLRLLLRRDAPGEDAATLLGLRVGAVMLVLSILYGFCMVPYGHERIAKGLSPETYGRAGVVKFVHGIAIHGIQLLPLLAFIAYRTVRENQARVRLIWLAAAGLMLVSIYAVLQTFAGRAREDATPFSGAVGVIGLFLIVGPFAWSGLRRPFAKSELDA